MYRSTQTDFRDLFSALVIGISMVVCLAVFDKARAQEDSGDTTRTRTVDILHADSSSGYTRDGRRIRSLRGNVRLRQEATFLEAERVLQYVDSDSIRFLGNVEISDEGDTLRAERVLYNQRSRIGQAEGDVVLTDGEVVLGAPTVEYYVEDKRAEFTEGAWMEDSVSVLTSDRGIYWFDEKKAVLHRSVRLDQPETVLTSDSLVHYRETDQSTGFGNVVIDHVERATSEATADTLRRTILFGERAEHDNRRDYRRISGDPFVVQLAFDSTGTDTLFVQADTIQAERTPAGREMQAVGGVTFWQRSFSAAADSVAYLRTDGKAESGRRDAPREEIYLYRDPIAWLQRTQISGDTLEAISADEQLDSLWVHSRAFVASPDTATERIHQLKGESLRAAMHENELQYVRVGPRGEVLRFLSNDAGEPDGAVQMSADYIEGWFENSSIRRAKAVSGIEGTYYEEENMPSSLQLDGFRWLPERRPTKESMLEKFRHGERFAPVTLRIFPDS